MINIPQKLLALKKLDPERTLFGANSHDYDLNDVVSAEDIRKFEAYYQCHLPVDYREFVVNVGNGGAGPHYGLFPLGMQDDSYGLMFWDPENPIPGKRLVGNLAAPFKFTGAWNLPKSFWQEMPDFDAAKDVEEEQRMHDEWSALLEREYYSPQLMNGAIPICHEGCGLRDWLVINGPFAGNVWRDLRADDAGIEPILDGNGQPMSFRNWYLTWLDESLAAFS